MQKLYYEDPHLSRFTATVLSCEETDRGYALTLDATAFYPEGGGQAADTGILGGVRVLDTKEQGETVVHTCDKPLEVGALVEGVIDYGPRFLRMQQHSGEHIVSGIIHRRYGYHNTGFHMGADTVTIDFDGVIPAEDLASIEAEANAAVWQNLPIRCWYPSPEELPTVPYRTKRQLPLARPHRGDPGLRHLRLLRHPCCSHRRDRPHQALFYLGLPGRHPDGNGLRLPGAGNSEHRL